MGRARAAVRMAGLFGVVFLLAPLVLANRLLALCGFERRAQSSAAHLQRTWARWSLKCIGARMELRGSPPDGPFLVAANHLSYLDIYVLGLLFPGRFVAKSEIAGWPLLGWMAQGVGTLFVNQSARRDVVRVAAEMDRTLRNGVSVLLFPEGRASGGDRLYPLKSSLFAPAAQGELPVLPVCLHYRAPGAPWGEAWSVAWWGGMPLWPHVWRLLHLPEVHVRVSWAQVRRRAERKRLCDEVCRDLEGLFEPLGQVPQPPWAAEREPLEAGPGL